MGKEWLYWVGGGVNSRSSGKRGRVKDSAGCMCGFYHLFHLHFPSTHRNHSNSHPKVNINYPSLQEETTTTRGVEAPRNSLELEEALIPLAIKQEEDLNFPVGIQIRTCSKVRIDDICSECSSPATKTPSLVARLMGLDLLPECTSPSLSSSAPNRRSKYKTFFHDDIAAGARSLPETPRVSLSRRSDVERHRLSLQINKENTNEEYVPLSDGRRGRFKHVKDGASRRTFGLDITNANKSRRDETLLLLKPAKKNNNSKISSKYEEQMSHSNAPPLGIRISDQNKIKPATNAAARSSRISSPCENQLNHIPPMQHKDRKKVSVSRLKKLPPRAAADRAVKNRREDGFFWSRESNKLNYKSKKTLLSCNNILQVKKVPSPPPPTNLPQEQSQVSDALLSKTSTQLSSKPSQSYNKILIQQATVSPCSAAALHGGSSPAYRNYIQTILKHSIIVNQANPLDKWHSPSNPLDPGIFHYIDHKTAAAAVGSGGNTVLSNQCNRKLIFHLVDELLAEILTPSFNSNRWVTPVGGENRFPLVDELCKKIDSFPAANCVVLEDVDSLIDTDLCKSRLIGYLGEEEIMVSEIEGEIVEWLVVEAVAVMGGDAVELQTETGACYVGL